MVPSNDGGTSQVWLMVIPNPDENVTVTELLLLRSNTVDDVVILSPTEDKVTSAPLNLNESTATCNHILPN